MGTYIIHHPFGGDLNHRCERGQHEYKPVATVEAPSLEMAFIEAQNHTNMKYCSLGLRSTSVGDIITAPDNTHHMVMPIGFQEVPFTVLTYIDWGNHMHWDGDGAYCE